MVLPSSSPHHLRTPPPDIVLDTCLHSERDAIKCLQQTEGNSSHMNLFRDVCILPAMRRLCLFGRQSNGDVVHLQAFLPRPMGHISNAPVFISGKKFYTITCTNVHRACAERKTREATPIENNQSFLTYKVLLYESQESPKAGKGYGFSLLTQTFYVIHEGDATLDAHNPEASLNTFNHDALHGLDTACPLTSTVMCCLPTTSSSVRLRQLWLLRKYCCPAASCMVGVHPKTINSVAMEVGEKDMHFYALSIVRGMHPVLTPPGL